MNILVVEDDSSIRDSIVDIVSEMGHETTVAEDGQDALDWLEGVDMIITDWMMPRIDGLELLRVLRRQGNDIYILFITARDQINDAFVALMDGSNDYMIKPFDIADLELRIHVAEATIQMKKALSSRG
jgi:DNA-binding response OmpR family regulator